MRSLTLNHLVQAVGWRVEAAAHAVLSAESMVILRAPFVPTLDDDSRIEVRACSEGDEPVAQTYVRLHRAIADRRIAARKKHGLAFYQVSLDGALVGSMWLLHGGVRYIDEVGLAVSLPSTDLWLRDVFVDSGCRGQRVFKRGLAKIVTTYYPDVRTCWSDTTAGNHASRRAHVAAGFEEVGGVRCVRLNPILIFRSPRLPSPLSATQFKASQRLILQSPQFREFDREMLA